MLEEFIATLPDHHITADSRFVEDPVKAAASRQRGRAKREP
jgi:hypothetical protein